MERTFINATIVSATIITAFMIMIPINHLSAQNDIQLDEHVKMRKATVSDVDRETNTLMVEVEDVEIPAYTNASTTFFLGDGEPTLIPSIKSGQNIYVFGKYNPETRSITAEKIVVRNKRITERTALSRAEMKAGKGESIMSPLYILGLTAR
jgi:hypothetical protein